MNVRRLSGESQSELDSGGRETCYSYYTNLATFFISFFIEELSINVIIVTYHLYFNLKTIT